MNAIRQLTILLLLCASLANAQEYENITYLTTGVKFVNERIIVNDGDTTSLYYTYTIDAASEKWIENGEDTICEDVLCCKYNPYPVPTDRNDSIISMISKKHSLDGSFMVYDNKAYLKAQEEGSNLTRPLGFMDFWHIYDYLYSYDDLFTGTIWRFITIQPEPRALKEDSFIEVDSILIEDKQMQRIAYIDEQGDTLAYIVQGIGFDSRDMGDLLTPFTRRPDPTADHQEWCGLSHVVKDGKIIYKGMRYREGAFDGIDEAVADRTARPADPHYYDLMGRPVGTDVPTAPGIYIHQGKKIIVMQ